MQISSIKSSCDKNKKPAFGMQFQDWNTAAAVRNAVLTRLIKADEEQAINAASPYCVCKIILFDEGGFLKVNGPGIKYERSHKDLRALFDDLVRTFTSCRSSGKQIPEIGKLVDIKV